MRNRTDARLLAGEKDAAPPGEHGAMDLDGTLSGDQPMKGRAPAPGRE